MIPVFYANRTETAYYRDSICKVAGLTI